MSGIGINTMDGYFVFRQNDKLFLFDVEHLIYCTISEDFYQELLLNNYSQMSQKNKTLFDQLYASNLFFYTCHTEFPEAYVIDEINFSLAPAHKCNFACKYCFADSGSNYKKSERIFSPEMINKVGEFLLVNFSNVDRFRLDFVSGGEPLININTFKYAVTHLTKMFTQKGKRLYIWMCTNASLLNDDILIFLDKNKIKIGMSLDGPKLLNDNVRVLKRDGIGTYDMVVSQFNNLQNSQQLSQSIKDVWGLSVIHAKNLNLLKILKHHKQMGFSSIQMKMVRLPKSNDLSIKEKELKELINSVEELLSYTINQYVVNNDMSYLLMYLNNNDYVGKYICTLLVRNPYVYRCAAGRSKFAFAADGSIYPCDSFVGKDDFCLGNVMSGFTKKNTNIFWGKTVADRPDCMVCWARFVCAGDCFHNSYEVNKSIEIPDPLFCEFARATICLCIYYLNELYMNSRDKYMNLQRMIMIRNNIRK